MNLDLDALGSNTAIITYEGKEIIVKEPSVNDVINLMKLSVNTDNIEGTETLVKAIYGLIPELKDKELTLSQLISLSNLLMSMIKTEEEKILEEKGVEVVNPKEKTTS